MKKLFLKIFLLTLTFTSVFLPQNQTVIILPAEIKNHDNSNNNILIDDISAFEIFLLQNKIKYSVIYSDDIDDNLSEKFNLIIIPTFTKFNKEEFIIISNALNEGSSIISFSDLSIVEDDSIKNFCEELYGVKSIGRNQTDKHNILQQFDSHPASLFNFENFELLVSTSLIRNIYAPDTSKVFSFGCANSSDKITTSFYGYKSKGRFAHFGFRFSKILSERNNIKHFENLLIKLFQWGKKNSGIWLTNDRIHTKNFLILLNLNQPQMTTENLIKEFESKNLSIVLIASELDKFYDLQQDFISKNQLGLKLNCTMVNPDSFIEILSKAKVKIDFLVVDKNCLNEEDLKKLSFAGIETILINGGKEEYYNSLYNILSLSYSNLEGQECYLNKLVVTELPEKLNCENSERENFSDKIDVLTKELKYFNRSELINELLISDLTIKKNETPNEFIIEIINKNDAEVNNILALIDSYKLNNSIVYDVSVGDKSVFFIRDRVTGFYSVKIDKISPRSKIEIKILYESNS